ncbi:restriction endonuclease subunit S [Tomitella gaofuii]|uniref:restriction endonuclease subunit S n=1 Tax=Tomitella gaofuii TaxID=2760083 RepID=UPI001C716B83|nr:restriction endonuclease subunit S [Tomitella gaofuii]
MPQNIGDNVIIRDGIAEVAEEDAQRLSRYRLELHDIVYSRRGDVEKRALVRAENSGWLCGTGCLRVRLGPESDCDPVFISYYLGLTSVRSWITNNAVGATMPNLNTRILSGVPLRVPGLTDQRAIADVLGALDDKIAVNRKLADAAEVHAKWSIWSCSRWVEIAEIADLRKRSASPDSMGEGFVAIYSIPAYDDDKLPDVCPPSTVKSSKFMITEPSVLVSKLNPRFPRVWDVSWLPDVKCYSSTEFMVLEPRVGSTTVLTMAILHPQVGFSLESKVSGTSGSHQRVRPVDLMSTKVPDPRKMEISVLERVTKLGEVIESARKESYALAALRDALLPRLMSGELRVKDAEKVVSDAV